MLSTKALSRWAKEDRKYLRDGAIYITLLTGGFAYINYREYIKKDFLRSEGHYRFN